jgi:hypothetical protein
LPGAAVIEAAWPILESKLFHFFVGDDDVGVGVDILASVGMFGPGHANRELKRFDDHRGACRARASSQNERHENGQ